MQRGLLNRTLGGDILPPLLVTFALSIIRQNLMLEVFSADSRRLQAGALKTMNLDLAPGMAVGIMPLLVFLSAVVVMLSAPKGLCGHLAARFDLHLFPVQRRVRLLE